MTILPHHIAATVLFGSLTVGGYFGVSSLIPNSLNAHLSNLGVQVLSDGWADKESEYLKENGDDLIASIQKETSNVTIPDFATKLEKWCTKHKEKYFLGEDDLNYKRFSRWCTKTSTIQLVLKKRGLKNLDKLEKEKKFDNYKKESNNDKFLGEPVSPKKSLTVEDLNDWCTKQKALNYKYESTPDLKRAIQWCYKN